MFKAILAALATVVPALMGAVTAHAEAHVQPLTDRPAIVFFLSVINPQEPDAYERYSEASAALLHEAGAVTVGRIGITETLLGDCKGSFFGYAEVENAATLQVLEQDAAANQTAQFMGDVDSVFLLKN